jgi:hypothetical protein
MEILSSKEYAKLISESVEEKETREAYEANLIEMGKNSANEIMDGFKQGAIRTLKYVMDSYLAIKAEFKDQAGLTWETIEAMLADISVNFLEEII